MTAQSEAPSAGTEHATPRPDLRGYRLGLAALTSRPQEQILGKRVPGLIGGFVAGLVVGMVVLVAGIPDVVAVLVAAGANLAVTFCLPTILLAPADRRLLRIVTKSLEASLKGWRRAYGNAPVPRTEAQQLLWIAAQPETTTDADAIAIEGSVFLLLGRYEAARSRAERLPDDTPLRRFDRELSFATIEFESGAGPGDLTKVREMATALRGARAHEAIVTLALEDANRAMIGGEDWDPPIARAAAEVGSPLLLGFLVAVAGAGPVLPWLLASEIALGAVLYLVSRAVV